MLSTICQGFYIKQPLIYIQRESVCVCVYMYVCARLYIFQD